MVWRLVVPSKALCPWKQFRLLELLIFFCKRLYLASFFFFNQYQIALSSCYILSSVLGVTCKGWARLGRKERSKWNLPTLESVPGDLEIQLSLWGNLTQLSRIANTYKPLFKHTVEHVLWNIITYLTKFKKVFCMTDIWHLRASDSKYSLQGAKEMRPTGLSVNLMAKKKIEPGHV